MRIGNVQYLTTSFGNIYKGTSTDTKPTSNVPLYSMFHELDTGDHFYFDGEEWKKMNGSGGGGVVLPTDTMVWYVNDVKVDTIDDVSTDYIAFTDSNGNNCSLEFYEDPETAELVYQFVHYEGDTPIVDNEPKVTICYYSNDSAKKNLAFNAISEFALWYSEQN